MSAATGHNILLAITGGIAAYKGAELARLLLADGHRVRALLTPGACAFITPLTLQALTGLPAHTELLDPAAEAGMGHIELAKWADHLLIAPASASAIGRLAAGLAGDLLGAVYLATEAEVSIAPAMNQAMWRHPAVAANVARLVERGVRLLGPAAGLQACGDVGPGRMLEPAEIAAQFSCPRLFAGEKLVITAGPTREALDPVRYLSNHSSGKMGYALAESAARAGARVVLISGPTTLAAPPGVTRLAVESAREMHAAVMSELADCYIFIGAAAVADYRPEQTAADKLKKTGAAGLTLALVQNPDILAQVAGAAPRPYTVGFAAETSELLAHATAKRARKGCDLLVANLVGGSDSGFNSDFNEVTLVEADGNRTLPRATKQALAGQLLTHIAAAARAYHHATYHHETYRHGEPPLE